MTPIEFLRTVWPAQGLYCIATSYPSGAMKHKIVETIEEAAAYVDTVSATENVFFNIHTLKAPRIWSEQVHKNKETKKWEAGWTERTQENARSARDFFFDLDVGHDEPNKPPKYLTQKDALTDLLRFIEATGLPKPMVVSSGSGLHVHWLIDQELDSNTEWFTHAARLKQLALHYKMKIDTSRTTDTASMLRVAGTFNRKKNKPIRPVEVLALPTIVTFQEWAAALVTAIDAVDLVPKAAKKVVDDSGLGSNTKKTYDGPPPSMRALITVCAQMRRLATLKGCNSYQEWFWGDIGIVKFTENGHENCHKISSGYPGYTYAETDAKIDTWRSGPTTCEKLNEVCGEANAHLCAECSFVKKNSSPLWAAALYEKASPPEVQELIGLELVTIKIPDPPLPYKRNKNGGIEIIMETKDGKQYINAIYPYDLYPIERSRSGAKETELQSWRAILPHDTIRDFTIEASTFVDERALSAKLANNGIYSTKFGDLRNYMSAYIQELQKLQPLHVQHPHLGWADDHTKFILPDKAIHADGSVHKASLSVAASATKEFVHKKGSLQKQLELFNFFNRPEYVASQLVIVSGLGAPLFGMTGHHGVILNCAGEPGSSKSTAIYTAASMWGRPESYVLNGTNAGATLLFQSSRRDILGNLPSGIDEITHIAPEFARTMAMNVSQNTGRRTMGRDSVAKLVDEGDRSSIMMTTANTSLHSLLAVNNPAGTAASVRVFEVEFRKLYIHETWEADAYLAALNENYGHPGEIFIAAVIKHYDQVKAAVIKEREILAKIARMEAEERFWFDLAAADIVGGRIAYHMRLIPYNMTLIRDFIIEDRIPTLRGIVHAEAAAVSPATVLTDYLERINGNMIKTLKPATGNLPHPVQEPHGELLAHYDITTKTCYVLREGFRRYCERRGQYSQNFLKQLVDKRIITDANMKYMLGRGTNWAKARSTCFVIDMEHPDIADIQLKIVTPVTQIPVTIQNPAPPLKGKPNLKVI